jgi:drug/metabolite transporter (DMT)-like permease
MPACTRHSLLMTPEVEAESRLRSPAPASKVLRQTLLLSVFIILAALTPMCAKLAMSTIPPLTGGFLRFGIAGSLLMLTDRLLRRGKQSINPIAPSDRWQFLWAALLCVPINQYFFLSGVDLANASHAGLFYALNPVLTFLITVMIGRSRWSGRMALAALLAFLGAGTLGIDTLTAGYGASFFRGDVLLFGAVLTWSMYSIIGAPLAQRYGAVRSAALVMFMGAVLDLPAVWIDGHEFDLAEITWQSWSGFAFITLGTSYLNYMIWFIALKEIDINRVSIAVNSAPLIAVMAAYVFLGEPITGYLSLGGVLILTAITLANWERIFARRKHEPNLEEKD